MYQKSQLFKYQLDKSSQKYICPKCGKKTFVLYLDASGQPLSHEVGKCDRKDNCNWHYSPKQYHQDHSPLMASAPRRDFFKRTEKPKLTPPSYIEASDFKSSLKGYERNSLMIYLHSIFDSLIGYENVNRIAMEYAVGTSRQFGGSPIYWQIDENGRIRSGKIMGYDQISGRRVKNPRPQLQWVHSLMKSRYSDFRLQQCYFGSHRLITVEKQFRQLNQERKTLYLDEVSPAVALFESEKACLIVAMALAWGGMDKLFIPVSCGGCEGFNPTDEKKSNTFDGIRLLKNRRVIIFPDEGKFNEWMPKAQALKGYSSEVHISTVMERGLHPHAVECEYEPGDALDDLILRYFSNGKDVAQLMLTSYGYMGKYKIV